MKVMMAVMLVWARARPSGFSARQLGIDHFDLIIISDGDKSV